MSGGCAGFEGRGGKGSVKAGPTGPTGTVGTAEKAGKTGEAGQGRYTHSDGYDRIGLSFALASAFAFLMPSASCLFFIFVSYATSVWVYLYTSLFFALDLAARFF